MPVLENIEAMTVNISSAPPTDAEGAQQTQPVRELTQTDHLNKRLLKSLLDSMKSATEAQATPSKTETDDNDFED